MNCIGDTLRKLRTKKNKSQQEVADLLNIDRKTYANWECNATDVKCSYIPKLAEAFGVTASDLFNQLINTFNIEPKFDNDNINTAILIVTDRDVIDRVLDVVNCNQSK